jgi:hypothetical protein
VQRLGSRPAEESDPRVQHLARDPIRSDQRFERRPTVRQSSAPHRMADRAKAQKVRFNQVNAVCAFSVDPAGVFADCSK